MLDIQKMIKTADFSDLINSTEEERKESGGNKHLYTQLADYLHFDIVREVIRQTFQDDLEILDNLNNQLKEKEKKVVLTKVHHDNIDYFITLPG